MIILDRESILSIFFCIFLKNPVEVSFQFRFCLYNLIVKSEKEFFCCERKNYNRFMCRSYGANA